MAGWPVVGLSGAHMWGLPHPPTLGAHGRPLLPEVSGAGWGCSSPLPSAAACSGPCFLSPLRSEDPRLYRVKVGGLTPSLSEPHSTLVTVKRLLIHSSYRGATTSGDIALMELEFPLQASQFSPVCLPGPQTPLAIGSLCWVTGWGSTQGRGKGNMYSPAPTPSQGGPAQGPRGASLSGLHRPWSACLSSLPSHPTLKLGTLEARNHTVQTVGLLLAKVTTILDFGDLEPVSRIVPMVG